MQFFSGSQHIISVTWLTRLKKETNTVLFHLFLKKLWSYVLDHISHSPVLHEVISQKLSKEPQTKICRFNMYFYFKKKKPFSHTKKHQKALRLF